MFKQILHIFIILVVFTSCIEEFNANLGEADQNILVVEGNIYSETPCMFYLSRGLSISITDYSQNINVDNAKVAVIGTDGSRFEGKRVSAGGYLVEVGKLLPDVCYSLEVEYDNSTFISEPARPLYSPEIEKLYFSQDSEATSPVNIMISNVENNPDNTSFYQWTYEETWELQTKYHPAYEYVPEDDDIKPIKIDKSRGWKSQKQHAPIFANASNFVNNVIKNYRLFQISNSDLRLSVLYRLDLKQFAISRAQYEYEQARRELSNDMGGIFSPQPSELITNIKCSNKTHRAIGYIGVCGNVVTKTLWINNAAIRYNDGINQFIDILDDEELLALPFSTLYRLGFRIADDSWPLTKVWSWVEARGVDVTCFGASLEMPENWR